MLSCNIKVHNSVKNVTLLYKVINYINLLIYHFILNFCARHFVHKNIVPLIESRI